MIYQHWLSLNKRCFSLSASVLGSEWKQSTETICHAYSWMYQIFWQRVSNQTWICLWMIWIEHIPENANRHENLKLANRLTMSLWLRIEFTSIECNMLFKRMLTVPLDSALLWFKCGNIRRVYTFNESLLPLAAFDQVNNNNNNNHNMYWNANGH